MGGERKMLPFNKISRDKMNISFCFVLDSKFRVATILKLSSQRHNIKAFRGSSPQGGAFSESHLRRVKMSLLLYPQKLQSLEGHEET